ncbi:MAG: hypothetical protein WAU49_05540 [Steroidobacteraceae bacterium]
MNTVTDGIHKLFAPVTSPEFVRTGPIMAAMIGLEPIATHPAASAAPSHEVSTLMHFPWPACSGGH